VLVNDATSRPARARRPAGAAGGYCHRMPLTHRDTIRARYRPPSRPG